jgi:hypothetical protein
MLFLAVLCASLAEYELEHKIERDKEKQFIKSMIVDLAVDTTNLASSIKTFDEEDARLDTILSRFDNITAGYDDKLISNISGSAVYVGFISTDRTMQQLKNSGAMRLISKQTAVNAIMDYDADMKQLQETVLPLLKDMVIHNILGTTQELLNYKELSYDYEHKSMAQIKKENKTYLLQTDKVKLGKFYNYLTAYKIISLSAKKDVVSLKQQAAQLIKLLRKEYHLEGKGK